jgi:hypothetical protein
MEDLIQPGQSESMEDHFCEVLHGIGVALAFLISHVHLGEDTKKNQ